MSAPATTIVAATPDGPVDAAAAAKRRRLRFVANPKAATGLVVLGFFCLIAIIGPWIAPFDPSARSSDLIQGPSGKHWFGTTHLGQDIFSQVLVGTRGVMFVGLLAGVIATALSLINFGIDEFVSPRLRSSGHTKVKTKDGHSVRMRVGFTPVLGAKDAPATPVVRRKEQAA